MSPHLNNASLYLTVLFLMSFFVLDMFVCIYLYVKNILGKAMKNIWTVRPRTNLFRIVHAKWKAGNCWSAIPHIPCGIAVPHTYIYLLYLLCGTAVPCGIAIPRGTAIPVPWFRHSVVLHFVSSRSTIVEITKKFIVDITKIHNKLIMSITGSIKYFPIETFSQNTKSK